MVPVARLSLYSQKAHTHLAHLHPPYIGMYKCLLQEITADTQSAHMKTNSTTIFILLLSLAEHVGGPLQGMCYSVDPFSSWAQTFSLPSSYPWIPVCPVAGNCKYKSVHSSCWYRPPCTLQHMHFPVSHQTPWPLEQLPGAPWSLQEPPPPVSYSQAH